MIYQLHAAGSCFLLVLWASYDTHQVAAACELDLRVSCGTWQWDIGSGSSLDPSVREGDVAGVFYLFGICEGTDYLFLEFPCGGELGL